MSEMAKNAREAMKAKAKRMSHGDPHAKVDASDWTPGEPMNANAQTGMRPVSKRQFRRGGTVQGEKAMCRADRTPRKAGGRVAEYVDRDVKSANAELGKPHVGGFSTGGGTNFRKRMHSDAGEDRKLVKHMVKPSALRSPKRSGGGQFVARPHKDVGGMLSSLSPALLAKKLIEGKKVDDGLGLKRGGTAEAAGMRPKGDRIARKSGGRAKGKTNIVINLSQPAPQMAPPPPAMMPKPPMGIPVPPPAPPGGMPPAGMPAAGLAAAGPQMPMPRKSGGRATYPTLASAKRTRSPKDMDAGSLGGLGRLEKTAIAEKTYARPR